MQGTGYFPALEVLMQYMKQSMRNHFELRRTFCPADHQSLAGHFEILLDISCPVKKKKTGHFQRSALGHFAQFPIAGQNLPLRWTFKIPLDMYGEPGGFRVL